MPNRLEALQILCVAQWQRQGLAFYGQPIGIGKRIPKRKWKFKMKVGDLVRYVTGTTAIVLYINDAGGTVKVVNDGGNICWLVTSGCEVISENR
tara:strand:- start:290 stop:571 length:282 start_codon:yes stop_codon:yes gene_type:complete